VLYKVVQLIINLNKEAVNLSSKMSNLTKACDGLRMDKARLEAALRAEQSSNAVLKQSVATLKEKIGVNLVDENETLQAEVKRLNALVSRLNEGMLAVKEDRKLLRRKVKQLEMQVWTDALSMSIIFDNSPF